MPSKNVSLLPQYESLRGQLQHALVVDAHAGELLHCLRTLDVHLAGHVPSNVVAATTPHAEIAFAWYPENAALSLYLYCNDVPVPGGKGIFTGGRLFVPIPASMLKPAGTENELVAIMRFLSGGWKYQLWVDVSGQRKLLDQGRDNDPGKPNDDSFIRTVRFGGKQS
ncbi:hypothetical protein EJ065_3477 [Corallococcus coralloides]|uniref:Uncharacterized protein n=1 Tax=Corallococcus coralloides TaxID=184914 RepID=A0A410RT16_CORCK|nr:hypothetical protein [Corallococcus coralloides]QAT85038.1 hypothetical protein EJ065_3477 [Corallococcus coralloides]RYZ17078.1 MAG: hypothetical protein EOO70_02930 [Myxococcaceae bacterium]